ncbi:MAG: Putative esterase [uncultured Friedmanniella sp.]|uniref:Esterase n=1 Tax=uncultured Friedmanniella sp. TaxID=335381 RepID=A0A6J4JTJ6_9ACTN|nr:MAG: Putative esterase [uncultured Friedmanniella sp.]
MAAAPIVLVPGYWLGGWAWERVTPLLRAAGHPVTALTLPGLEAGAAERAPGVTLEDHVGAVADAVRAAGPTTVLVAHSGAGKVVTAVLDREPAAVARVVYVDSGPAADGLAEPLPPDLVELALPPWSELEASVDGLSEDDLATFRKRAVPHPAAVVREPLRLHDPARRGVPATLVACSFPAASVLELAGAGHPMFAEVAELSDLTTVDLPTGHWPMWSRPGELAELVAEAAGRGH